MYGNKPKIYWWLWPFSILYRTGVDIRNKLFDLGVLHSQSFPIPLISIGNLAVGGTGKTPHTEYLVRLLKKNFKISTLSRGYGRKTKGFILAGSHSTSDEIGDEPCQMAHKFRDITVAVDENRCRGVSRLMESGVEVVLLDDAFQHRYVKPGMSILLTEYNRPFYKDWMLPAGRLREPESGKRRADIIIVTKCPEGITPIEQEEILRRLNPLPHQEVYFTTMKYGALHPLFSDVPERSLNTLEKDEDILLLTGIASPETLLQTLKSYSDRVYHLSFLDHHSFNEKDMRSLATKFRNLREGKRLIVTTEKDAARLISQSFPDVGIKPYIYTIPIEIHFLNNKESAFNHKIIDYVRKNSRNGRLYQSQNAHLS